MIDISTLKVGDTFWLEQEAKLCRLRICRKKAQLCYTLIRIGNVICLNGKLTTGGLKAYIEGAPVGTLDADNMLSFDGVKADITKLRHSDFYKRDHVTITKIEGFEVTVR